MNLINLSKQIKEVRTHLNALDAIADLWDEDETMLARYLKLEDHLIHLEELAYSRALELEHAIECAEFRLQDLNILRDQGERHDSEYANLYKTLAELYDEYCHRGGAFI